MEAVRLRIQDIDFGFSQITVRSGKGDKDRVTPLPVALEALLKNHIDPSIVNKAIKIAIRRANIDKRVGAHTFRHSFAIHLLQRGTDIRTMQTLLGHNDVATTMIYTHVLNQGGHGVKSPLDDLLS